MGERKPKNNREHMLLYAAKTIREARSKLLERKGADGRWRVNDKLKFEGPYGLSISKITLRPTPEHNWTYGPVTCIQVERAGCLLASVYPHPCGEFVARPWHPILTGETLDFLLNMTLPCVFQRIIDECMEKYGPLDGIFNWTKDGSCQTSG